MIVIDVKVSRLDSEGRSLEGLQRRIEGYLPSNYAVTYIGWNQDRSVSAVVKGHDRGGWTAEGYVVPRLLTGLYGAEVVSDSAKILGEETARKYE